MIKPGKRKKTTPPSTSLKDINVENSKALVIVKKKTDLFREFCKKKKYRIANLWFQFINMRILRKLIKAKRIGD